MFLEHTEKCVWSVSCSAEEPLAKKYISRIFNFCCCVFMEFFFYGEKKMCNDNERLLQNKSKTKEFFSKVQKRKFVVLLHTLFCSILHNNTTNWWFISEWNTIKKWNLLFFVFLEITSMSEENIWIRQGNEEKERIERNNEIPIVIVYKTFLFVNIKTECFYMTNCRHKDKSYETKQ